MKIPTFFLTQVFNWGKKVVFIEDPFAGVAQPVEQLICNQQVAGSSPIASSSRGGVPEWLKGADCKSVGDAFGGSNPPPPPSNCAVLFIGAAGIAQLVERQPSKLNVAGSSPVSRSTFLEAF